jgi:hypothetical protein
MLTSILILCYGVTITHEAAQLRTYRTVSKQRHLKLLERKGIAPC